MRYHPLQAWVRVLRVLRLSRKSARSPLATRLQPKLALEDGTWRSSTVLRGTPPVLTIESARTTPRNGSDRYREGAPRERRARGASSYPRATRQRATAARIRLRQSSCNFIVCDPCPHPGREVMPLASCRSQLVRPRRACADLSLVLGCEKKFVRLR